MYFIPSFLYQILMECLLCTSYCARVWGNLKFGSLGNRVGHGDVCIDLLKRALGNSIFEEVGEARLGRRVELWCSQQLRTWMEAQRLWLRRNLRVILNWGNEARPLCAHIGQLLDECLGRVALFSCGKFQKRDLAVTWQQAAITAAGGLEALTWERAWIITPWHPYHEVTNKWTGQNFCSHGVGSWNRWEDMCNKYV